MLGKAAMSSRQGRTRADTVCGIFAMTSGPGKDCSQWRNCACDEPSKITFRLKPSSTNYACADFSSAYSKICETQHLKSMLEADLLQICTNCSGLQLAA